MTGLAALLPPMTAPAATINVTAFGAVPNDGIDDLPAITNALNAATVGDTVFIPNGVFRIDGAITAKSGVSLAGAGRNVTTVQYGGSALAPMINVPGRSSIEITGFTLDGNSSVNAAQGINAFSSSNLNINNIRVQNLVQNADFGPHGIYFSGAVTDSVIADNEFQTIGVTSQWGAGIRLAHGSSRNQVLNNTIDSTGRGGILANNGSSDLIIRNNTVTNSGLAPVGGEGLGIELFAGSDRSIVEDNRIDHWLSLDSSSFVAVRRNTVTDPGGRVKFIGLEAAGGLHDVIFSDNVVDGGAHLGLSMSNAGVKERIYVAGNTISDSETWGAQLQSDGGIQQIYFYDNTFEDTIRGPGNLFGPTQGHGFRVNGNSANGTTFIDLDSNRFISNGGYGVQLGGSGIDQFHVVNNSISGNGSDGFVSFFGAAGVFQGADLLWTGNTVSGNGGSNAQPSSSGFTTNQLPGATIDDPGAIFAGQSVMLSFSFVDDGTVGAVLWDFDEGLPVTTLNPTHVFSQPGVYQVALVVWDDGGRAAHHVRTITVLPAATPEPASFVLVVGSMAGLIRRRARRDG